MAGLLSAEAYKLRKSRVFYICILTMAAALVLLFGIVKFVDQDGSLVQEEGIPGIIRQLFSGNFLEVFLAVFTSVFVVGEHGSGMLKNIVGKGKARSMIFLAKFLVTLLAAGLLTVITVAAAVLCGRIFLGREMAGAGFSGALSVYTVQQAFLLAGLTAVFVVIAEVCRNLAAAISIGIVLSAFSPLLAMGLDLLCGGLPVTLSEYWLVNRSIMLPLEGFSGGDIAKNMLVAAVWILAAALVGVWHFNRTDIR